MRKVKKVFPQKDLVHVLILFLFSLAALILIRTISSRRTEDLVENMFRASQFMRMTIKENALCREERNIPIHKEKDINQTGLIGLERSAITTTLGHLEAKRTSINPNFAGLFVYLFSKTGVEKGDTIAAGVSSSFPGLILAMLSAARILDLEVRMICSLGSSQWGANHPGYHWMDIMDCLRKKEMMTIDPIALSLGGEKDIGEDMDPEGRFLLNRRLSQTSLPVITESVLAENVSRRMHLYSGVEQKHEIAAFVNIGGSWANMGTDPSILDLKPGVLKMKKLPPQEKRGVIQTMAAQDIPVIHCLYIQGLVEQFDLEWDPHPLPYSGEGGLYELVRKRQPSMMVITGIYFLCVWFYVFLWKRKTGQ